MGLWLAEQGVEVRWHLKQESGIDHTRSRDPPCVTKERHFKNRIELVNRAVPWQMPNTSLQR